MRMGRPVCRRQVGVLGVWIGVLLVAACGAAVHQSNDAGGEKTVYGVHGVGAQAQGGGAVRILQPLRPPRSTRTQRSLMANISAEAKKLSHAAQPWVQEYMGANLTREGLDPILRGLSDEELYERFVWEFERLPILHNTPVSMRNGATLATHDGTPSGAEAVNGYVQSVCHRYIYGGNQTRLSVNDYALFFFQLYYGMPAYELKHWTVSQANECFTFHANNLQKASRGNMFYGGWTYVLNRHTLKDRLIVEAWDAGMMVFFNSTRHISMPPLGVLDAWLHTVQPHESYMNEPFPRHFGLPPQLCCDYSLADLFNRWWVPHTRIPRHGMMLPVPYYEYVVAGSVLLPEDLLYSIAAFSNATKAPSVVEANYSLFGVWGTRRGRDMQKTMKQMQRPLVWASSPDSPMIIDPIVGSVAGDRITADDREVFERFFEEGVTEQPHAQFRALANALPPYLLFHLPSWTNRAACEVVEEDESAMVMGVDAAGNCVYWSLEAPPSPKWECMNDGTCEAATVANSPRAVFDSEEECMQQCGVRWTCVKNIAGAFNPSVMYCGQAKDGEYESLSACESQCYC